MSSPTPRAMAVLWFVVMQAPMNFTNTLSYGCALVYGNTGPYEEESSLSFYPNDLSTFPLWKTKTLHTHAHPSTRLCMCADSYSMGPVYKGQRTTWRSWLSPSIMWVLYQRATLPTPIFLYKSSYCFQFVESKLHCGLLTALCALLFLERKI